jgi:hypothetical protein
VYTGAEVFLNGADGTLDLSYVTVGRDNVSDNGEKVGADAVEFFVITVQGGDGEASASVCLDDWPEGIEDSVAVAVRHERGGAITNVAGDGVKKWDALYIKNRRIRSH